ncbi:MAG: hypothetical protein INQ03_25325 [Candidatus Heimdallarchaeota archaeon]|nr:hypothetical protein [Candidatus Heimdallarchaeota archaeon]
MASLDILYSYYSLNIMTYLDQITTLWESKSGDLSIIMNDIVHLLKSAKIEGEEIPKELECELLLQANYSLGFGNEVEDAKILLDLIYDMRNSNVTNNLLRLTCLGASSILSNLAMDEEQNTRNTALTLSRYGMDFNSTKSMNLRIYLDTVLPILESGQSSTWWLELASFMIIFKLIIQRLGSVEELDDSIERVLKDRLDGMSKDEVYYQSWRDSWVEKNDYYRFNSLLITGTFAPDTELLDIIKQY